MHGQSYISFCWQASPNAWLLKSGDQTALGGYTYLEQESGPSEKVHVISVWSFLYDHPILYYAFFTHFTIFLVSFYGIYEGVPLMGCKLINLSYG